MQAITNFGLDKRLTQPGQKTDIKKWALSSNAL